MTGDKQTAVAFAGRALSSAIDAVTSAAEDSHSGNAGGKVAVSGLLSMLSSVLSMAHAAELAGACEFELGLGLGLGLRLALGLG